MTSTGGAGLQLKSLLVFATFSTIDSQHITSLKSVLPQIDASPHGKKAGTRGSSLTKPKCSGSKHTRGVWQKQPVKRCAKCPHKRQPPHLLPSCKEFRASFNLFLYFEGVPNYFWPSWQQMSKEQVKKTNRKRVKGVTASEQLARGTALLSPHLYWSPTLRGMPGTSTLASQHQAHQRGDQLLQDVLKASLGLSVGP